MSKREFYYVRVDKNNNWTSTKYRKVTDKELDKIIIYFKNKILQICSNGSQGAMTMWAYFKNLTCAGCYNDIINAYSLLSNDYKSLVDREHEFRHLWNQYRELYKIRYYGSVEEYHLAMAKNAKNDFEKYKIE